jgi:hypothetical protein
MKKLSLVLAVFAFFIVSCEEEEDKSWEKADLIGKWEQVSPQPSSSDCDDYKLYDEFSETEYKSITSCDGMESSVSMEYEFDGTTITYSLFGTEVNMEIKELTDSNLKYKMSAGGETETYEYTKVTQ